MLVTNQDGDETYFVKSKDIYYRPHFIFHKFRLMFMGWNLYAKTKKGRALLGTFDSRNSCKTTIAEIKQHEKAGRNFYVIPEEADTIEDILEACDNEAERQEGSCEV
jgi:hypothetical protein